MMSVLVVEDEPDIREDLADLLRDEGYQVATASNGVEALGRLRAGERPCVILLDLMMPQMDGFEFRSQQVMDPQLAAIPVVVVSGASNVSQKAAALNAGAYLIKPFRVDDLLREVARFCAERGCA